MVASAALRNLCKGKAGFSIYQIFNKILTLFNISLANFLAVELLLCLGKWMFAGGLCRGFLKSECKGSGFGGGFQIVLGILTII